MGPTRNLRARSLSSIPDAMRTVAVLGVGLAALACACSPSTSSRPSTILPLRTLRLYETGVGYFERTGSLDVGADRAARPCRAPRRRARDAGRPEPRRSLQVPRHRVRQQPQPGHGPRARRAARGRGGTARARAAPRRAQGSRVDVRAHGETHTGRLIDVVTATEDGVVAKAPAEAARPTRKLGQRRTRKTGKARESVAHSPRADRRRRDRPSTAPRSSTRFVRSTRATPCASAPRSTPSRPRGAERAAASRPRARRTLTLGYVAETPVWRTTYRLVFDPSGAAGVLEGWALLHNDTDEDWKGVKVELANGRPDSFLFPARGSSLRPEIARHAGRRSLPPCRSSWVYRGRHLGRSDRRLLRRRGARPRPGSGRGGARRGVGLGDGRSVGVEGGPCGSSTSSRSATSPASRRPRASRPARSSSTRCPSCRSARPRVRARPVRPAARRRLVHRLARLARLAGAERRALRQLDAADAAGRDHRVLRGRRLRRRSPRSRG